MTQQISRTDLKDELKECRAFACFLTEAIALTWGESSTYTNDFPVPAGAALCLRSLTDKIQQLCIRVEGGIL